MLNRDWLRTILLSSLSIGLVAGSRSNAQSPSSPAVDGPASYPAIVLQDEPIAYWRFEESKSEKLVHSLAKNELSAKPVGKVTLGQPGPRNKFAPLFDSKNTSAELLGGKDYLQVQDPGDNSPLDFGLGESITLEAWVNPRSLNEKQFASIISKGRTGNKGFEPDNLNYALRLAGGVGVAQLNFLFRSQVVDPSKPETDKPTSNYHRWTSDQGFPVDSGWHHIAVSYTFGNEQSLAAYIDGKRVEGTWDMGGATQAPPHIDNDELWLGSAQANHASALNGWIDEVAIYRKTLAADRIALRYQRSPDAERLSMALNELPNDRVITRIFEGLLDKTWGFELERPVLEYDMQGLAYQQIPQKYNERGIIEDRKLPLLVQSQMKRTLAKGKYRIWLRSKNASRLWIDDKLIASHPFLTTNGDGHEPVPVLPPPPQPHLRPAPPAHRDRMETIELQQGEHTFRLEGIVGGRSIRPEPGEVVAAIAGEGEDFVVLTPDLVESWSPTEERWTAFANEEEHRVRSLNQSLRTTASAKEDEYWKQRHEQARELARAQQLQEGTRDSLTIDHLLLLEAGASSSQEQLPMIDDAAFLRRVTLDTIGIVPTREELLAFLQDTSPTKRTRKIDALLADPRWADHWVGYWQDVLAENPGIVKPEQNNTGPFRWWIYESFLDNKPVDRFATELVLMEGSKFFGGTAGFAMASQNDAPMAAKAQILTRAFLGMDMACARCHDSPNSPFKQKELFSLAAMLHRNSLDLPASSTVPANPEGRKPLITVSLQAGDKLSPEWHLESYPVNALPNGLVRNERDSRERFAAILTSPNQSRFAKVIVNRLWHRYMGWGIVEPIDNWEAADAKESPLLDYLANELLLKGYDLKQIARLILNSKAYQSSPLTQKRISEARNGGWLPKGPTRRRLSAEQLVDSLFFVSGKPFDVEPMTLDPEGRRPPEQFLHLGMPRRAWQFASTSTDRDRPALIMPAVQQVSDLLSAFGWRDSRPAPISVRDESASPLQSQILGNGLASTRLALLSDDSRFTEMALRMENVEELIAELFESILGRAPTDSEKLPFVDLLTPGFESRQSATVARPSAFESYKRNAVSWANHLVPEATRIKLALEQEILRGDHPTNRLEVDWRERLEDSIWALFNSTEFLFIP